MGGGGGPTNSTVTQSNIPDWLRPQVEQVLGGATKELFKTEQQIDPATGQGAVDADGKPIYDITGTKPFTPYASDPRAYVAGFSPLQQQVQANVANLRVPGQFNQATGLAGAAGMGGMQSAQQALGYGNAGFQSGMAGQNYANQVAGQAGAQAAGYGNAGFQSGQQGQQLGMQAAQQAAQRAAMGEQAAYGYGDMGVQAGLQGQQSGLLGQNLGIRGGEFYGGQGAGYGADAAGLVGQAQGFGREAADIGQMGLRAEQYGRQISGRAEDFATQAANAGKDYSYLMRSPELMRQFMSPYQQSVTDVQIDAARRQADISRTQRGSQAARAGAFGGARQAIENAEAERALQSQLSAIQAQGSQSAYDRAQQAIQAGMGYELQGVGAANQSLGTALQGGQLGLSGLGTAMQGQQAGLAGLQAANQLYGTGIQGAGLGLQGVQSQLAGTAQGMQGAQAAMQGAGVGLSGVDRALASGQLAMQGTDRGLAGTAQGMQGAQVGLAGVGQQLAAGQLGLQGYQTGMQGAQAGLQGVTGAQAGYGLANQSAGQLGQLGTQQLAAQQGILGLQNQIGGQQQSQEQQYINQAIQNFANAQNAPMDRMNQYNALLRGYALPGQTTTQYQAQPTLGNQLAGFGTAAVGATALSNAMGKKKGGTVRSGIADLGLYNAMH